MSTFENRTEKPVSLTSEWSDFHAIATKNQAFFDNDKRVYISQRILSDYTVNADIIPNLNLNITNFLTVGKASFYDNPIIETVGGETDFDKKIDTKSLAHALHETIIQNILNKVGILKIRIGNKNLKGKLSFESIKVYDVIYDYTLDNVIIRLRPFFQYGESDNMYYYEWYQRVSRDSEEYNRVEFIGLFDQRFDYNMFGKSESLKNMSSIQKFKALPVIFFFSTSHRKPVPSNFVDVDLIMNLLLGFGLANAPSSLLVKIFIKAGLSMSPNSQDLKDQFGDILDILGLKPGE